MLLSYFTPLCGSFCSLDCPCFCLVICPHLLTFTKLFITFCAQKMFGEYFYKKAALFLRTAKNFYVCAAKSAARQFLSYLQHISFIAGGKMGRLKNSSHTSDANSSQGGILQNPYAGTSNSTSATTFSITVTQAVSEKVFSPK